jgi:hypothetical protein
MPFRGTQTETIVTFDVKRGDSPVLAQAGWLVETRDGFFHLNSVSFGKGPGKYSLQPSDDPTLEVSSGPLGGTSEAKTMLAVLKLPDGEVMTFSLNVTRSKWSYRKLGLGLLLVLTVSIVVGIITSDKRRRFKYHEQN